MIEYKEIKTVSPKLNPYINEYLFITWDEEGIKSKDILPSPGASMLFTNHQVWINNKMISRQILIGIHHTVFNLKWEADKGLAFIIRFTPYGLSRFLDIPIHQITNKATDCNELWGNAITKLHEQLLATLAISEQVELIEHFLSERFIAPATYDDFIFKLADALLNEKENLSFSILRKRIPLSVRQLERRFKALTGVNIQTYIRICRFDKAKYLLVKQRHLNLTDIAYTSGYFDQAHFSNEFKILSKLRPKNFLQLSPFYKFLSELTNK